MFSEDATSSDSGYRFLAFARIFSGKIKKGQKLYVLGPKHDPTEAIELVTVLINLYDAYLYVLLMYRLTLHITSL